MCIGSHQAEERNTTFIMGHALLKKAILHLKRANGRFILQGTVFEKTSGKCYELSQNPGMKLVVVAFRGSYWKVCGIC